MTCLCVLYSEELRRQRRCSEHEIEPEPNCGATCVNPDSAFFVWDAVYGDDTETCVGASGPDVETTITWIVASFGRQGSDHCLRAEPRNDGFQRTGALMSGRVGCFCCKTLNWIKVCCNAQAGKQRFKITHMYTTQIH